MGTRKEEIVAVTDLRDRLREVLDRVQLVEDELSVLDARLNPADRRSATEVAADLGLIDNDSGETRSEPT